MGWIRLTQYFGLVFLVRALHFLIDGGALRAYFCAHRGAVLGGGALVKRSAACLLSAALVLLSASIALAQATSSISGTVVDSAGGAIPGVAVVVASSDGGQTLETTTNAEGIFNIPSVAPGAYKITVSLSGFKTAVTEVRVAPGTPTAVKLTLEVGAITETVNVSSSSELINTQTAVVASTLNSDQLNRMPTPTRNALNAVTFLPGINTLTTNRNSTINGLPESMIQITMDGVSNNDNFLRSSDSFFASVTPRQDAVEAVSVIMAVGGANVGGSGAVSINFTTRSGGNRFAGTAYEYWRHPSMNTNYFFNELNGLEKNDIKLNQYGARISGPVQIPGVYNGQGKMFYMLHYEQLRFPNSFTRTRSVLNPRALEGWFRYEVNGQTREVNVLSLAAANGQISATDPTVMSLLHKIEASMATTGTINTTSDPLLNQYVYLSPGRLFEHQPTLRIDYNVTDNHRLTGSYAVIWALRDPDYLNAVDARFPGAPNYRYFHSKRPLGTATLRSTLSKDIVNELKFGVTAKGGASYFGDQTRNAPGVASFDDQGGYAIDFDADIGLTNWFATNGPSWRSVPTYEITNTMTWQKNTHSLMFGGTWLLSQGWENAQQIVPGINLGFNTTLDPAAGLFNTTNFANASGAQLTDARQLYALLTGRVTSVTSQIALDENTNKYVQLGPRTRAGGITVLSGFAQDTWRWTPTVTLTGGLRYDVQLPFKPTNDIMSRVTMEDFCGPSGLGDGGTYSKCNFLRPGTTTGGVVPEFKQLTSGTNGYKTDWNNLAPTIGVAWRPNVQDGWLRNLMGDPEQATLRAGYGMAFERQGLGVFTGIFGANPGSIINTTRSATSSEPLVPPGQTWPVLLSQRERLYLPSFSPDPTYPIPIQANRGSDLSGFAPDVKIGSAHTWNVSFQRSITRDMAVEVRYVGTRGRDQWSELDYNGIRGENLVANKFIDEFRLAQANLQANNIAGGNRLGSFAYFGPGTGTNPLPVYLAYFNARTNAGDPAAYTGTSWTNTTFAGRLVRTNPSPTGAAGDLDGDTGRRANAIAAGLPANFFVVNPLVDEVNVTDSGAFSDYHALQVELRRRLSRGLQVNVNYQYAIEGGSAFDGFSFGRTMLTTTGGAPLHAIKSQWDWTIPVGRGQRFGANLNGILDGILGGWSVNAVSRTQQRLINFGNVNLVGMSKDDLQSMYKFEQRLNPATGLQTIFLMPDDVILNTRRAFSTSSTSLTGYSGLGVPEGRYIAPANSAECLQIRAGDCAPRELIIKAPWFSRVDFGITKKFPLGGTKNVEVRFDVLNLFDNINFNPTIFGPDNSFDDARIFQVTSAYTDASNTYDPGGRLGQLMFRFNW